MEGYLTRWSALFAKQLASRRVGWGSSPQPSAFGAVDAYGERPDCNPGVPDQPGSIPGSSTTAPVTYVNWHSYRVQRAGFCGFESRRGHPMDSEPDRCAGPASKAVRVLTGLGIETSAIRHWCCRL